jgi:hypothetical protein
MIENCFGKELSKLLMNINLKIMFVQIYNIVNFSSSWLEYFWYKGNKNNVGIKILL